MAGGGMISASPGGRASEYNRGRLTPFVMLACFVGACTGLVFGYDIGIAGGVTLYPDFQHRFYPHLKHLEDEGAYCQYKDPLLALFVSSLFLAGLFGAVLGSLVCKRLGRRPAMILAGAFFLVGAVLLAAAPHIAMLIMGRVIMGLGVGVAVQAGPLFLSEIAPFHLRGAFNTQFQLFITIGILLAQCINYANQDLQWGWRLNLALAAVPALLLMCGAALVPDTPNSLVERRQEEQGKAMLRKIRGVEDVEVEFDDIVVAAKAAQRVTINPWRALFSRRFTPQLVVLVALQVFNQMDGINTIMFYAPQLFSAIGSSRQQALLMHVIIGVVNVVTTLVAVFTVDSIGRTFWMVEASVQMCICEIVMGVVLATQMDPVTGALPWNATIGLIVVVCVFISGHAWGWGPMPWLVCSEVQPLHTRAAGTALATMVNFLLTFVIGQCFLHMLCSMRYGVFFFFAGWLAFMGVFTKLLVPETKGIPIEAVEDRFHSHWLWGRVMADTHAAAGRQAELAPDGLEPVCKVTTTGTAGGKEGGHRLQL